MTEATVGTRRTRRAPNAKTPLSRPRERRLAYLLVLPAVIVTLVSLGYPLVRQVVMSFQQFGLAQQFGQAPAFVGLVNYATVLGDPDFWASLVRSVLFCVIVALVTMVIGTLAALVLTRVSRPIAVGVQIVMLLAWAMPVMSSLEVFQWMFNTQSGVINWALTALGLTGFATFNWLAGPLTFFIVAGLLVTWMSVPLVVFMVYAAVTQIDESVLEAAQLDGAGAAAMTRYIIMPSIAPVLLLVSMLEIIWDLRIFTQIHVLQGASGITAQTNVLGTYIFQAGLSGGNYGVASAAAILMLALSLLFTGYYLRRLLKEGSL